MAGEVDGETPGHALRVWPWENLVWVGVIVLKIFLKPEIALRNLSLAHNLNKKTKYFSLSTSF